MRLLILGGTTEASALARRIAGRRDLEPVLSFAGRTRNPVPPPIPFRIGGFGGVEGLKAFLVERKIDAVVDATHPFAAQMSHNTVAACGDLGVPLAVMGRPPWHAMEGDRWTSVATVEAVIGALGMRPRRVFLTIGGVALARFATAPHHYYVIRTIDPPQGIGALASHRLILARGPFSVDAEISLMREERTEVLVTKNSGGSATEAKLAAARALGVEVIMIERPIVEEVETFNTIDTVLNWIDDHHPEK
jgi:precorrin-6A/cobalt-precorrin-6A reductase